jgi:aryl-alcohol dehydrogenase-like predicted oxidoreductase
METISGKKISSYCFGTMQFGKKASEADSASMYSACRGAGINFFDTAYAYTEGRSEEILGELIAHERDDVFIATKCANLKTATSEIIHREFSESRRRLKLETVDALYIHQWDPVTPLEVSLGVIAGYVNEGAVRYVALSNFAAWQVMKAQKAAEEVGITISLLQPMYNLVKRQAEVEILPMAVSEGFAVAPYSPLGGGLLTGKYVAGDGGRLKDDPMYALRYAPTWMHDTAAGLAALAAEAGVHSATLAVAWVARHKGVSAPIISARSTEQLEASLAALSFDMDDDLYSAISALSPAPPPATDRLEEA